ncbi:MAG: TIR domain-containing protein [Bryobacterales bacterium]|nr:TIR domain-containing protein [Bryobacterales bacterium]
MTASRFPELEWVSAVIQECLKRGETVEIAGLGRFHQNHAGRYEFESESRPKVFLAYATEDAACVERLYDDLEASGFSPWMDRRKLLPGQRWRRQLRAAVAHSDYFVACFSKASVNKRGGFQEELREALQCAMAIPLEQIYFIPVRLNACDVPEEIRREVQYVDLFPEFETGYARLAETIRRQERTRQRQRLPEAG